MVSALFYILGGLFLALSLYRLAWHLRHGKLGGLAWTVGRVASIRPGGLVVDVDGGTLVVDSSLAQVGPGVERVGRRVTVAMLQGQPVRLLRETLPQLPWLRWPQAVSGLLCLVLLLVPVADPVAAGLGPLRVSRTIKTPAVASRTAKAPAPGKLAKLQQRLRPLHRRMGRMQPGDWLASHREPGETFRQYLAAGPVHARGSRQVIYIQPIGAFQGKGKRILDLTAEFMSRYFCLPVRVARPLALKSIPARARRRHPTWGVRQILTSFVLESVLKPRRPKDAAAYIGFTTSDLWPGRGWNFVFGQASLSDRVGVWSIHRNGDPETEFDLCLLRTLKTAVHETGHMFSMRHCTAYECNMCGSNNRSESDRRPIPLCPECLAKTLWATGCDARARYRGLVSFFDKHSLKAQARAYRKLLAAAKGR